MAEYKSRRERRHAQGGKIGPGHPMANKGPVLVIGLIKKRKDGGCVEGGMAKTHLGKRARGGATSAHKVLDAREAAFSSDGIDKIARGSGKDEREVPIEKRKRGGHVEKRADGGGSKFQVDDKSSKNMGDLGPPKTKSDYKNDGPAAKDTRTWMQRIPQSDNTRDKDMAINPTPATADKGEYSFKGMPVDKEAPDSTYKKGGRLTAGERHKMPSSEFALPGKGEGPGGKGAGSYPIENASHARNALARVSQHGTPAEKAKVRAAVHRKFPGIHESE